MKKIQQTRERITHDGGTEGLNITITRYNNDKILRDTEG